MTRLETLLIMAYNVGRDHGETSPARMSKEEGRTRVLCLVEMVRGCDLGDLDEPFPTGEPL